jgi:excisionase family DNA binding protein
LLLSRQLATTKQKKEKIMTDELLTTEQAVTYLKISKRTLFRMIHDGKIRALKVGNTYRFKKNEIDEDLRINEELRVATR